MSPIRCGQVLQRLACDDACDLLRAIEHRKANAENVIIGKPLLGVCGQWHGSVPRDFPKCPHCGASLALCDDTTTEMECLLENAHRLWGRELPWAWPRDGRRETLEGARASSKSSST